MKCEAAKQALATRPVIHARAMVLLEAFLKHKKHSKYASSGAFILANMETDDLITPPDEASSSFAPSGDTP